MEYKISKPEFAAANSAVVNILSTRIEDIEVTNKISIINNNAEFNKVFKDKVSVLYVDISKSGKLIDALETKNKAKIYRSFIRLTMQAIRYSGGEVRQCTGEGIMGVFIDTQEEGELVVSSVKAVKAGRYITTLIDYCLNPLLKKYSDEINVALSIGISTSDISVVTSGMRGKKSSNAEYDLETVWVGSAPYDASCYCQLAKAGEMFIDPKTFKEIEDKTTWEKCIRLKDDKPYGGFVATSYYLDFLDNINIKPVAVLNRDNDTTDFMQEIFKQTKDTYIHLVEDIIKKSSEWSNKYGFIESQEKEFTLRESMLHKREVDLNNRYLLEEYKAKYSLIDTAGSKFNNEQIKDFGKDFWLDIINRLTKILQSTSNSTFNGAESWNVSKIYLALEQFDKYYDELCNMAKSGFPIWESEIRIIKNKTFYRSELIESMKYFIKTHNISKQTEEYKKLIKILEGK